MRALLSWSFVAFFAFAAHAADPQNGPCKTFPAPLKGGYCVYPGTSPDIAYYLHGKGGSEKRWAETNFYSEQLRQYWAAHGEAVPTIVTVSFGPLWLFDDRLLGFFSTQFIPQVETALGGLKGRRLVFGESMGGFNSVQAAFRTRLFSKGGFVCPPMLVGLTPWSTAKEMDQYMLASTAYGVLGKAGVKTMRGNMQFMSLAAMTVYSTPEQWEAVNPLSLAAAAAPARAGELQVYTSAGLYDEYVLYEGVAKFAETLSARGYSVEYRPLYGGHCVVDVPSLAEFLVR